MITQGDIRKKAENKYYSVLRMLLSGQNPFPLVLSGTGIGPKIPFRERMKGIEALKGKMKTSGRPGYILNLTERTTRSEGCQTFLKSLSFPTGEDYFAYLEKSEEVRSMERNARKIRDALPELAEWVARSPRQIIRMTGLWDELIAILVYFRDRETAGLYLREVPLELPTKFPEKNEAFLRDLLDIVLPEDRINKEETDLSLRYGLKKDRDFRFRILIDPAEKGLSPFHDLAVLPEELAEWKPASPRILIIENKLSFLLFPEKAGTVKIWGNGKGVTLLRSCNWLKQKDVLYWGDLDPQGFEILSMVREFLPDCRSVCMDKDTFLEYERFSVVPGGYLPREDLLLNSVEKEAYSLLVRREKGCLEQEKLPLDFVAAKFDAMIACIK